LNARSSQLSSSCQGMQARRCSAIQNVRITTAGSGSLYSRSRIHECTISLRFLDIIVRVFRLEVSVSPAYGFSALALVKCSNEEGPGPRHNMKKDPGTSTLIMKGEHGQEVPCDPGQVTTILGRTCPPPPSPPTRALRTEHPPTPFQRAHPTPSTSTTGEQPRRKHTSASGTRSEAMGWARGG